MVCICMYVCVCVYMADIKEWAQSGKTFVLMHIIKHTLALAGVAQWIECQPVNQRVTGSIPNLGHMPGLQARSTVGGA